MPIPSWLLVALLAVVTLAVAVRVVLPLLVVRFVTPQRLWRGL